MAPNYFPPPLLMSDPRAPFHPACNFSHFLFYFFSFGKNPSKFITPGQKRERSHPLRAESRDHCNCDGPSFSCKGHVVDMVCRNLRHVYFLEVGLLQSVATH